MQIETDGDIIKIKELGSGHMLSMSILLAFISIPLALSLWPVLNSNTIEITGKIIYFVFVSVFFFAQVGTLQVYRQAKNSVAEINRVRNDVYVKFGKKEITRNIGSFDHILAQEVKIGRPRKTQYCAVLIGKENFIYLHICRLGLSGLKKDLRDIESFLGIETVKSTRLMKITEFEKSLCQ